MRVISIYRKNLNMTEGKIASQIAHAVIGLGVTDPGCTIVVLKVSDKKFSELTTYHNCYVHSDLGLTEVSVGEPTAAAWVELK
jgi:peptidyl-tRNA hydrolase